MSKIRWLIIGISGCIAAGGATLPAHRANLDYVRSATALKVMKDAGEPGIVFQIKAEPADERSISRVSGRAVRFSQSESDGLLTRIRKVFTFDGKTKSYCMEIEPGCLVIDRGPLSELVSVAVAM
jgi:hypothetical protein